MVIHGKGTREDAVSLKIPRTKLEQEPLSSKGPGFNKLLNELKTENYLLRFEIN